MPALRVLIDACLTPAVVAAMEAMFGSRVDAVHVDRVLPQATPDDEVVAWAIRERRLVITANDSDFLVLMRDRPGHPGLALINDQNTRLRQIAAITHLVQKLLDYIDSGGLLVGHVFVVRRTGRLTARRIPPELGQE
jgi:predicted nuclease of predicted toxin-antitoxin system